MSRAAAKPEEVASLIIDHLSVTKRGVAEVIIRLARIEQRLGERAAFLGIQPNDVMVRIQCSRMPTPSAEF